MTSSNIQSLLEQGENSAIEFKNETVRAESLAKEIVAFSNSSGGEILIGVEDDGSISGVVEKDEEWVSNVVRNNVIPAVNASVEKWAFQGKAILHILIPKGKDKPYQTNQNQFFIRVGSTNRAATQQELLRLFQESGIFHFDLTGVERTTESVLNKTRVDQYFDRFGLRFDAEAPEQQKTLLQNADILREDGRLTVAGALCFAINPARYLPQSTISFAHFLGNEITEALVDRQVITGTLDMMIDAAFAVLKNNLLQPSHIVETKRVDGVLYSDKVFRELITNACAHRDYSISGSGIRIFLFDNRIEFRSPGRLPNTLNLDKIRLGGSYARNPVIVSYLQYMGYIDKLGRGLPLVIREAREHHKSVDFAEIGEEFVVTLER
jgi:ATP-dependent DNA helicase RecG